MVTTSIGSDWPWLSTRARKSKIKYTLGNAPCSPLYGGILDPLSSRPLSLHLAL
jgi:hypothetical protein